MNTAFRETTTAGFSRPVDLDRRCDAGADADGGGRSNEERSSFGFPVRNVLDVPIHAMRLEDVLDAVDAAVARRSRLLIGVVNAAKIVAMRKDALLRDSVLSADLVLADGMAVVWASRLLGQPLPERVAGIDLMFGMLKRGSERAATETAGSDCATDESWTTRGRVSPRNDGQAPGAGEPHAASEPRAAHGYRVYCLGATEEVSQIVADRIARDYPGIVLAGRRNGYFSEAEEPRVVEQIRASSADILFVAMSPPKKEIFLGRYFNALNVSVCHGVGGAFDVFAGKTRRAPVIWQRLGMEWLYRVVQEPRRMWKRYLVTNVRFCWIVSKAGFEPEKRTKA